MNRIIFSLKTFSTLLYWLIAVLLMAFLLFGCRTKKQIDWANECATRYPIKEKIVKGETVYYTDTIIEPGLIIQADPILLKVKCPDSKVITKTINRVDTVIKTNTAEISLYKRQKEASDTKYYNEQEKRFTAEETAQKYRKQRNAGYWFVLALGAVAFRKQIIGLFKLFLV